jgi:hypothetical protein
MLLGTTLAYSALDAKDPDKGVDKKRKKHDKDPSPAASSPDEADTTTDKSGKQDKKHDKKEKEGNGEKEKGDKRSRVLLLLSSMALRTSYRLKASTRFSRV